MSFPETLRTLPSAGTIYKPVGLIFTRKAYQDLCQENISLHTIIKELLSLDSLKINPGSSYSFFKLFIPSGELIIKVKTEACLITRFKRRSQKTIRALILAYEIQLSSRIDLQINLPRDGLTFSVINYKKESIRHFNSNNYSTASNEILKILQSLTFKDLSLFSDELKFLLRCAKNYTILEGEIFEKNCLNTAPIFYQNILPSGYRDGDRISYIFVCIPTDSELNPGDYVCIMDKSKKDYLAEVIRIKNDEKYVYYELFFMEQISTDELNLSGVFYISSNDIIKSTRLSAIQTIYRNPYQFKRFSELLNGKVSEIDIPDLKVPQYFNERQQKAYLEGLSDSPLYLVLGPPGTGKTSVISEWAKNLVANGKSVLITSQNNKAVDNVLLRLNEYGLNTLRIGSNHRVDPEIKALLFEYKCRSLSKEISESTATRIKELKKDLQIYQDITELLNNNIEDLNLYSQFYKEFINQTAGTLTPIVNRLEALKTDYETESEHFSFLEQSLKKEEELSGHYSKTLSKRIEQTVKIRKIRREYRKAEKKLSEIQKNTQYLSEDLEESLDAIYLIYENLISVYPRLTSVLECLKQSRTNQEINTLPMFSIYIQNMDYSGLYTYLKKGCWHLDKTIKILEAYAHSMGQYQNYGIEEHILNSAQVIGATCNGILSQDRFRHMHFDVSIVDEAGQILLQDALIPLSISERTIMVGDYNQIPPQVDYALKTLCIQNRQDTALLEQSFFEYLYKKLPDTYKTYLNTQYRMPAEIAETIGKFFYDDFISPESKRNSLSLFPSLFKKPYVIIDTSDHPQRFETREAQSLYNLLEVDIITSIIKALSDLLNPNETGIISAYKGQINHLIKSISGFSSPSILESIATLDSFQGQERDLIIYSFVRSNQKDKNESRLGFLSELRRINVAMTRTKKMLILIGDMSFLSECCYADEKDDERSFSSFMDQVISDVKAFGDYMSVSEFNIRLRKLE